MCAWMHLGVYEYRFTQLYVPSLPFLSLWQLIPQIAPYPFTLFERLLAIFIFDKARPTALLCIADSGVLK